jgi:L-threonylcarbamoyladenylate synthase
MAAPSANRFGAVSPTAAEAVEEELGSFLQSEDLILDGGQSAVGIESSIFDCTSDHPIILRPGAITREMIEETTGVMISINMLKSKIRTSGALKSHYSPKAKVIIGTTTEPGDGFIAQANIASPKGAIRLASPKSVELFAKNLYEALRLGDKLKLKRIVIAPPSGDGLALAINDRINKAESHQ